MGIIGNLFGRSVDDSGNDLEVKVTNAEGEVTYHSGETNLDKTVKQLAKKAQKVRKTKNGREWKLGSNRL